MSEFRSKTIFSLMSMNTPFYISRTLLILEALVAEAKETGNQDSDKFREFCNNIINQHDTRDKFSAARIMQETLWSEGPLNNMLNAQMARNAQYVDFIRILRGLGEDHPQRENVEFEALQSFNKIPKDDFNRLNKAIEYRNACVIPKIVDQFDDRIVSIVNEKAGLERIEKASAIAKVLSMESEKNQPLGSRLLEISIKALKENFENSDFVRHLILTDNIAASKSGQRKVVEVAQEFMIDKTLEEQLKIAQDIKQNGKKERALHSSMNEIFDQLSQIKKEGTATMDEYNTYRLGAPAP